MNKHHKQISACVEECLSLPYRYCRRLAEPGPIWMTLLKIYLRPPPPSATSATSSTSDNNNNTSLLLNSALKLIQREGHRIGSVEAVLELIPDWVGLEEVGIYLRKAGLSGGGSGKESRLNKILVNVWSARLDGLQAAIMGLEERRIKIDERRL